MRYWLFYVMPDVPKSWAPMLRHGIAAQDYHKDALREPSQTKVLSTMRAGDKVLAAYGRHRFLGYGTLKSDLGEGEFQKPLTRETGYAFRERFDCEWVAIPFERDPRYVTCHGLKERGLKVDLKHGFCVAQTDARTFRAVNTRIDDERKLASQERDLESIFAEEGRRKGRFGNYYERKPKLRKAAIALHGETCMVCGFNFGKRYGERGEGFIEVHHLKPISGHRKAARIFPKRDMVVLCSNCHRMIHRRTEDVWSPARLRSHLKRLRHTSGMG